MLTKRITYGFVVLILSANVASGLGTWEIENIPDLYPFNDIDFTSTDNGWAVGQDDFGHYYSGGWQFMSNPSGNLVNAIHLISDSDGWIVGKDGTILRYNGSSWNTVSCPTNDNLCGLHFVTPNDGWATAGC
ncbi:MAG: hypothetical protein GY771_14780 [bacterium]|nr:hypothetical protein [bacterium]